MKLLDSVQLALRSISGNLLRAILTLLIVAIGILALVGIFTAIDGIKGTITQNFASMGANSFDIIRGGTGIRIGGGRKKRVRMDPIKLEQVQEFKERFSYPATVSIRTNANFIATVRYKDEKTDPNIAVRGTDENYLFTSGQEIEYGRNFSGYEIENANSQVIIGASIAKRLFGKSNFAIDKVVRIDNKKYKVIGVLADAGASGIFSSGNQAFLPYTVVKKAYARTNRNYTMSIAVKDPVFLEGAISEATGLFRTIRKVQPGEDIDFEISKADRLASILIENTATLRTAASVIGFITLFGAAIGLMNIMLVSVTERTREIGISKAIGADDRSILFQFLLEAILICLIGGVVGIFFGIIAGNIIAYQLNGPFVMPWRWIALGIAFCVFVGLVSGIYPAVKASRLDPIESLRYE